LNKGSVEENYFGKVHNYEVNTKEREKSIIQQVVTSIHDEKGKKNSIHFFDKIANVTSSENNTVRENTLVF